MKRILLCGLLWATGVSGVGAGERWLHVRIGEDGERTDVRINVPLSVATGFLSAVDPDDWTERADFGSHGTLEAREGSVSQSAI